MNRVCPERITQARELADLSKSDLAEALGVSPAAVTQWESGVKHPSTGHVVHLARALNVPMPLLLQPMPREMSRKGPVTFRAWSSVNTRRANRRAERLAELCAEVYLWIEKRVTLPPVILPEVEHLENIELAAQECRRAWGLGDRPLLRLGELLESKGIVIGAATFGDQRFDAFSCFINGRPFIFLGDEKGDRARSRFDAVHELGHLLLHQHHSSNELSKPEMHKSVEQEAHAFAGAFLMPEETFRRDVVEATLEGFLRLKPKWGVSAQAMIHRSHRLGIITDSKYQELYRRCSARGWRKAQGEPYDDLVPSIKASLGKKSFQILEANGIIQAWQIAADLPIPPKILSDVFGMRAEALEPKEFGKIIPLDLFPPG